MVDRLPVETLPESTYWPGSPAAEIYLCAGCNAKLFYYPTASNFPPPKHICNKPCHRYKKGAAGAVDLSVTEESAVTRDERGRWVWHPKCEICGEEFSTVRSDAKYCSAKCRKRASRANVTDKKVAGK